MLRQISSRPALFRTGLRYFDAARNEGKKFKYVPGKHDKQDSEKKHSLFIFDQIHFYYFLKWKTIQHH